MSRVGFAVLAHQRPDRVAALARWLGTDGHPVAVHLDRRVGADALAAVRAGAASATVMQEHAPDWGRFGLVEATLALVRHLLGGDDPPDHVCLLSGACLPLRPIADLEALLAGNPGRDFIESVPVAERQWVEDGLSLERFTLWHPFSHRRQPRLFSAAVEAQRKLGVKRRLPDGVEPNLGAQWWCLSRQTLRAILDDPRLPAWRRFFHHSWIPDESFFQSLVRTVRPEAEPGPLLHLNRFNTQGRPSTFHDDHLDLLRGADHFFARKIDPDANGLYDHFLSRPKNHTPSSAFSGRIDETPFEAARQRVATEGQGALSAARMPKGNRLTYTQTEAPYLVLIGDDLDQLAALRDRIASDGPNLVFHGRLMRQGALAEFAGGGDYLPGNLPANPALRDYRASQFLARVLGSGRPQPSAFLLGPDDDQPIRVQLCSDPNARLVFLTPEQDLPARISHLRRPLPPNKPVPWLRVRRRRGKPSDFRAWHRAIDPAGLHDDLNGPAMRDLAQLVASDWADPANWQVPA